jgi:iron complex outermembrane receptor protein
MQGGSTLSGITGVEAQRQNATTIGYGMIKDPADPNATWFYGDPYYWIIGGITGTNTASGITSDVYTTTATTSVFTEWTLALQHDLSITAGIGLTNMKIKLDDRFYNPATPFKTRNYDTTYGFKLSPHLAINKIFSKQFSAYASYNSAYKDPVSSYFYIPYAITGSGTTAAQIPGTGLINNLLRPEKADQFEIGTKGNLMNNKLTYQLAFFDITYNNKLTNVNVLLNPTTTAFSYVVNGGKQDSKGVEALVKYTVYQSAGFLKSITPFANFTYSDFEYKDYPFHLAGVVIKDSTVNYKGNAVAGVSKIIYNAGFDVVTKPGLYGNFTFMYKDKLPITSDNLNYAAGYTLLNAKLGFQHSLSNHFDLNLYFGVNNIANSKYPIMVFVNQIPDAYIAGPRYANYYGGINLKYNF